MPHHAQPETHGRPRPGHLCYSTRPPFRCFRRCVRERARWHAQRQSERVIPEAAGGESEGRVLSCRMQGWIERERERKREGQRGREREACFHTRTRECGNVPTCTRVHTDVRVHACERAHVARARACVAHVAALTCIHMITRAAKHARICACARVTHAKHAPSLRPPSTQARGDFNGK